MRSAREDTKQGGRRGNLRIENSESRKKSRQPSLLNSRFSILNSCLPRSLRVLVCIHRRELLRTAQRGERLDYVEE